MRETLQLILQVVNDFYIQQNMLECFAPVTRAHCGYKYFYERKTVAYFAHALIMKIKLECFFSGKLANKKSTIL